MTTERKSRIPAEMYETASGLNQLGFIDKRQMGEFGLLCKLKVPVLSARQIKTMREELEGQPGCLRRHPEHQRTYSYGRSVKRNPAVPC